VRTKSALRHGGGASAGLVVVVVTVGVEVVPVVVVAGGAVLVPGLLVLITGTVAVVFGLLELPQAASRRAHRTAAVATRIALSFAMRSSIPARVGRSRLIGCEYPRPLAA
jgi:hypothetical protein